VTPPPLRVWLMTALLLGAAIALAAIAGLVFGISFSVLI
jgi:hypothetical protein